MATLATLYTIGKKTFYRILEDKSTTPVFNRGECTDQSVVRSRIVGQYPGVQFVSDVALSVELLHRMGKDTTK